MKIPSTPAKTKVDPSTIPPAYLSMAAAHMQQLGKLSLPTPSTPTEPVVLPKATDATGN